MAFWNHVSTAYQGQPSVLSQEVVEPGSLKQLMIDYVGQPKYDFNIDTLNGKIKSSWTVPEALRGENPDMKVRIDYLAIHASNFLTEVILPIQETDNLTYTATRWIYSPTIAQPVAEQARVRTFDSTQITLRGEMEEFGLGLDLPIDFMTTAFGIDQYDTQVLMLDISIRDTLSLQVLHALLSCYNPAEEFERIYQYQEGRTLLDTLAWEREKWDIIHLNKTPLQTLQSLLDEKIASQRAGLPDFDTFIMHQKTLLYTSQVVSAYITYSLGGQEAVDRLNAGPTAAVAAKDLRGNDYYTVKTYNISGKGNFDQMIRETAIGEYYTAHDRFRKNRNGYKSIWRRFAIYDWSISNFRELDLRWLIDNCHRFDPVTGRMYSIDDPAVKKKTIEDLDQAYRVDSMHFHVRDKDGKTKLVPADYFAQLLPTSLEDEDFIEMGETSVAAMKGVSEADANAKLTHIHTVLGLMENVPLDHFGQLYMWLLRKDNLANGTSRNAGIGLRPMKEITEFRPNIYGGLDLVTFNGTKAEEFIEYDITTTARDAPTPAEITAALKANLHGTFSEAQIATGNKLQNNELYPHNSVEVVGKKLRVYPRRILHKKYSLPPGFANWPGLQTIAAAYKLHTKEEDFVAKYQLDFGSAREVAEYVTTHIAIVDEMRRQFVGSVPLNAAYCSSWWHSTNAETVFFDMLISRHRSPAFLYSGPTNANNNNNNNNTGGMGPPDYAGLSGRANAVQHDIHTIVEHITSVSRPARDALQSLLLGFQDRLPVIRSAYLPFLAGGAAAADGFGVAAGVGANIPIAAELSPAALGAIDDARQASAYDSLVLFDPQQPGIGAADGMQAGNGVKFHASLPPFARARYTKEQFAPYGANAAAALGNLGLPGLVNNKQLYAIRLNAIVPAPQPGAVESLVVKGYRLASMVLNQTRAMVPTRKDDPTRYEIDTEEHLNKIIKAELVHATLVAVLQMIRQDDVQDLKRNYDRSLTPAESEILAKRIIAIYENVHARYLLGISESNAMETGTLANIDPDQIAAACIAHMQEYVSGRKPANENPYKYSNAQGIDTAQRVFAELKRKSDEKHATVATLLVSVKIPTEKSYRGNWQHYRRAPITLSPFQIRSCLDYMRSNDNSTGKRLIPSVMPSDPHSPEDICTPGDLEDYVAKMKAYERNPTEDNLRKVPPAHRPPLAGWRLENTPVYTGVKRLRDPSSSSSRLRHVPAAQDQQQPFEDSVISELEGLESGGSAGAAAGSAYGNLGGLDYAALNNMASAEGNLLPQMRPAGFASYATQGSAGLGKRTRGATFGDDDLDPSATETEYDATLKAARSETSELLGTGFDQELATRMVSYAMPGRWNRVVAKAKSKLALLASLCFCLTPITRQAFYAFIDNNLVCPLNFLIMRANMRFITRPIIWMVAGESTGVTRYGKTLFTWGDDGDIRKWRGKYTFYAEAVVEVPENIAIINDCHVDGYAGGLTTVAYSTKETDPNRTEAVARLASVYVCAEPFTVDQYLPVITTTGRPQAHGRTLTELLEGKELNYHNVWYYRQVYQFTAPGADDAEDPTDIMYYFKKGTASRNIFLHQGLTHYWDPNAGPSGAMRGYRPAQGHYPTHVWNENFRKVVTGAMHEFTETSYEGWSKV